MTQFLTLVLLVTQIGFQASLSSISQASGTYQQLTVSTTAVGLLQATTQGMAACAFTVEANPVRFRLDQPPTATVGTPLVAGDTVVLQNITDARAVRFIRSGAADAIVNANCWSQ